MNNSWNLNGNSGGNSLIVQEVMVGSHVELHLGVVGKKKKSDADLSFNRFWKVNGKKAVGSKRCNDFFVVQMYLCINRYFLIFTDRNKFVKVR